MLMYQKHRKYHIIFHISLQSTSQKKNANLELKPTWNGKYIVEKKNENEIVIWTENKKKLLISQIEIYG